MLKFYRNEVGPLALRPKPAGVTIKFPKIFSFIEAPDEALDVLEELVAYCHDDRTLSVVIDQSECELIELGAEAVAGVLAKEGKRIGTGFSGYFPEDPEQAAIAYSAGIRRALKPGGDTHKWEGDILCFPLRHGRNDKRWSRICVSAARGTEELIDYLDVCLREFGWKLNPEGKDHMSHLVGEVITNAEEHSELPDWWVSAYLHKQDDDYGDAHVTIFNLGRTIAESMQTLPEDAWVRREIERLIKRHQGRRYFERGQWQVDDLWTLYALQEKGSHLNIHPDYAGDRGHGIPSMVEAFQVLGKGRGEEFKMCIVSGQTCILFDGRFPIVPNEHGNRVVAFNDANSLAERPNPIYVKHLRRSFPGTIISLRFFLDKENLYEISRD